MARYGTLCMLVWLLPVAAGCRQKDAGTSLGSRAKRVPDKKIADLAHGELRRRSRVPARPRGYADTERVVAPHGPAPNGNPCGRHDPGRRAPGGTPTGGPPRVCGAQRIPVRRGAARRGVRLSRRHCIAYYGVDEGPRRARKGGEESGVQISATAVLLYALGGPGVHAVAWETQGVSASNAAAAGHAASHRVMRACGAYNAAWAWHPARSGRGIQHGTVPAENSTHASAAAADAAPRRAGVDTNVECKAARGLGETVCGTTMSAFGAARHKEGIAMINGWPQRIPAGFAPNTASLQPHDQDSDICLSLLVLAAAG
ncbi:hypothetical protein GGX14DRAFT_383768 [Mycena pura]|uniref:Uncharacterized protein n=1 Tax=Mycena pura TaxID=153505 RepID=A0AAD6YUL1_9AGAR|nr:hypothetical protein GGX14DRAFT_383768 [Mycena pura]